MPNHVHCVIEAMPGWPVGDVVGAWKSFTAKAIHRLLYRLGSFWQSDYFDRYIRDDAHLAAVIAYIESNPVKAGLCAASEAWPWGSAAMRAGCPRSQEALS
jgi:REP element-mobilizing transposase RayT